MGRTDTVVVYGQCKVNGKYVCRVVMERSSYILYINGNTGEQDSREVYIMLMGGGGGTRRGLK